MKNAYNTTPYYTTFCGCWQEKECMFAIKNEKSAAIAGGKRGGLCSNVVQNVLHDLAQEEVLAVHGNIRPLFVQGDALVVQVL